MRFVFLLLTTILVAPSTLAAPGDKVNENSKWPQHAPHKDTSRSNYSPNAPDGFIATKIASNLGSIVAVTSIGRDLFVADAKQNRVLRLKNRTNKSAYDTRAEYLIGFNQIQDIVSVSDHLFMSDRNGIWKIEAGNTLIATEAPKLIFASPDANSGKRNSIAAHPNEELLYVSSGNCVFEISVKDEQNRKLSCGNWHIQDIAVSPTGSVWASAIKNGNTYILPIRPGSGEPSNLKLPPYTNASDLFFWDSETYPKDWPQDWGNDLIISLEGNQPMIARAHFNFGDIDPEFTVFVDGFSKSSRFVGRRNYWGAPSAITTQENGQLIFAEREQGALWILEQDKNIVEKQNVEVAEPVTPISQTKSKPKVPDLIKGSSIKSASSLETDELLRRSTQPDQKSETDKEPISATPQ